MPGFNFNMRKVIKEAAEVDNNIYDNGNEIDVALAKNDLEKVFDSVEPIEGEVAVTIKEMMSDPEKLRIAHNEASDTYYIEYNEFANFCEATGTQPAGAVDLIFEFYKGQGFEMNKDNFSIVFPPKSAYTNLLETVIGYQDIAWSSHFLKDAINNGVKCTQFIDPGVGKDWLQQDPEY